MANYVSSIPNGETVDALLSYVSRLTTANDSEVTNLILSGIVLTGRSDNNYIVNSTYNTIDSDVTRCTICGGGASGFANKIGSPTKPAGTDYTPTGWADDTDYPAGAAGVATIAGGYDNIINQIAGTICGGGHNFIKYNPAGHSFIGGGSYNCISAGRSSIISGTNNSISGTGTYGTILCGLANSVIGSYSGVLGGWTNTVNGTYSTVIGGNNNSITGNYGLAYGRKINISAAGVTAFTDSQDADFNISTADVFAGKFAGGYWLTGGNIGIGTTAPSEKVHILTSASGESNSIRLENTGLNGTQAGVEFWTCRPTSTTSMRSGRIYSTFDGASYSDSRITIQSIKSGDVTDDTLTVKNGTVGIGTSTPNIVCSAFEVKSTTRGMLPPRMTTKQRDAISNPVEGLMIFNTTSKKLNFYNGTAWETVTSGVI
jgi:hypothetical protein